MVVEAAQELAAEVLVVVAAAVEVAAALVGVAVVAVAAAVLAAQVLKPIHGYLCQVANLNHSHPSAVLSRPSSSGVLPNHGENNVNKVVQCQCPRS